ncbi:uncharacterized protein LOC131654005 [Vicia villosa]|uniref:uncharacterized protein LOC131654005 n=1 Tax=Vicia villosa TaxID=3911 RepID=UPI00273B95A0|nr:uncharacterized protein LOC131654005 [Vicia villosa]
MECILFKVDFEKAYDKVSWNFLRFMMNKMRFGARWMWWMEETIFTSHMSILVNGSPSKEFAVEIGLRQGDPISPFLFVIVTEALAVLVRKVSEIGDFSVFQVKEACSVDLLQFADDTLLIGNGGWQHVWFKTVSFLNNNISKSIWWKDLINLEKRYFGEDFLNRCSFVVCNGASTSFWNAVWIKYKNLKSMFPALYALSNSKGCSVVEAGSRYDNCWTWGEFGIPISHDPGVNSAKVNLRMVLLDTVLECNVQDYVIWNNNEMEVFAANIGYKLIHVPPAQNKMVLEAVHKHHFEHLWKTSIPFRIKAFGWRYLWNRLPTIDSLLVRGIVSLPSKMSCCFCNVIEESLNHILILCSIAKRVWEEIEFWFGIEVEHGLTLGHNFDFWIVYFRNKNVELVRKFLSGWLFVGAFGLLKMR